MILLAPEARKRLRDCERLRTEETQTGIDIDRLIREESLRHADAIAGDLKRDRVNTLSKVRVGIPFVEVIKEAHETQADFVVKVSESMASKRSNIGTTDLNLLRQCPCPVWITRRRERAPYEQ